ncbi:DUF4810 domain-containing protein [Zobellella iuensis]|uniref:DUF4810 domain-containing protein n=1 Tax=Zobellella iuensis TaxID=2803811 RepID=A0ABS1QVB7_9GAMM|nr:DUF4810 domain-containing protein [Zobellella iuensis]MBL1378048.1 DUF4810 domain-containing protein [Zobellella iuensis]
MHNKRYTCSLLMAAVLLAGCAGPGTLYQWDAYQPSVYQYYQVDNNNLDEQVAQLEESIEKARAKDRRVAPGLHAHLGLLYANSGREQQALEQFATEKRLFPESAVFMDFLLKQNKDTL